jgi:hypothetical protein
MYLSTICESMRQAAARRVQRYVVDLKRVEITVMASTIKIFRGGITEHKKGVAIEIWKVRKR